MGFHEPDEKRLLPTVDVGTTMERNSHA